MPFFANGTIFDYTELQSVIKSFATQSLATFDDAFEGGFGTSSYGSGVENVVGLTHKHTGIHFLLDFVPTYEGAIFETTEWGGTGLEYAMVGLMVKGELGEHILNLSSSDFTEGTTLVEVADANLMTFGAVVDNAFTVTATDALTFGDDADSIPYAEEGYTIEFVKDSDGSVYLFHVDAYTDETELILQGDTPPASASDYRVRVTANTGYLELSPADIVFGQQRGGPWVTMDFDALEVSQGWFPNSRRLDFDNGIEYWLFGNNDPGDDYFHIVLRRLSDDTYSHWWLGQVASSEEIMALQGLGIGAFMGCSGPYTDDLLADSYRYVADLRPAEDMWQNPMFVSVEYTDDDTDNAKIYLPDGGSLGYGVGGVNEDPEYGPSSGHADSRDLDTANFSIQNGINGFRGPYSSHPANMYGGTGTANAPLLDEIWHALGISQQDRLIPFAPVSCHLTEIPFTSVASTRVLAQDAGAPVSTPPYYSSKYGQFVYLGEYPGVYRSWMHITRPTPQTFSVGDKEFMLFPVTKSPDVDLLADMFEETPGAGVNGSGQAGYLYRKA